ncbi:hypothetical protein, partial [Nonomuraea sp. NPDC049141]|uniref:hypothetical protein n=1 Tax=Nonomuraea sp. NPDC049141 TaxID=3155500 RepID=UPI0033F28C22
SHAPGPADNALTSPPSPRQRTKGASTRAMPTQTKTPQAWVTTVDMSLITVKATITLDVWIANLNQSHTEAGRHTSLKIILIANGCFRVPQPR